MSLGLLHLLGMELSIAKIRKMCEDEEVLGTQKLYGEDIDVKITYKDPTHYLSEYNEYFVRYEVLDRTMLTMSSPYPRLALSFPIEREVPSTPKLKVPPLLLRVTVPTDHGPEVTKFEIGDTEASMVQFVSTVYQVLLDMEVTLIPPTPVTDDERIDIAREVLIGRLNRTPQMLV